MAGATDRRRGQVLRAIIADYISLHEPVGSKALLERHQINVSSATIRNDMAVLESEGYITQRHASSGRVPTEKGYRAFVDSIHDVKPLSTPERRAIVTFLEEGVDLEDVLRRSVHLLAQLTRQAAVVQLPTLKTSRVKHCEVVALGTLRLLLVLITDTGRVDQRNVELASPVAEEQVHRMRDLLNEALQDKTMAEASTRLAELAAQSPPELHEHMLRAATVLRETLVDQPNDRLIMAGASNLTRIAREFPVGLPDVISALEEQVVMLKLMADLPDLGNVSVVIGEENEEKQLHVASIVTSAYGNEEDGKLGGLGVVGPTYMDYPGTMSKVSAVARYVGRILQGE